MPTAPAETWIFGYGSLMWNPGFVFAEARRARLTGYHRAFCIYSIHYRGTMRRPGLVLGLDRGGVCEGLAFRIAPGQSAETLAYLRRRELIYGVYREALVPVELAAPSDQTTNASNPAESSEEFAHDHPSFASPQWGEADDAPRSGVSSGEGARAEAHTVWAIAYIAERAHPAYAGRLPLAREAALIRRSAGHGGTNLDYLASTRRHLMELGIREPRLDRLVTVAGARTAAARTGEGCNGSPTVALTRAWATRPIAAPRTVRDNRFGFRARLG